MKVAWHGGGTRQVAVVNRNRTLVQERRGTGAGPMGVRRRPDRHQSRDEYFFTTDVDLTPQQIIAAYTGRWAIEVMFQEVREHLGLESTRGWCEQTIHRAEPCLFGLYSLVARCGSPHLPKSRRRPVVPWTGRTKSGLKFSDAITLVRREIWRFWV